MRAQDAVVSVIELDNKEDVEIASGINMDIPWLTFVERMSEFDIRADKNGPAYIAGILKPEKDWVLAGEKPNFRHDINIQSKSMIVFDLDEPEAAERTKELFQGFEYIVHSSHSLTKEHPYKKRIVLPLESPLNPDDWKTMFDQIKICVKADASCGNLSRLFYYPSISPNAGIQPYFEHSRGQIANFDNVATAVKKFLRELSSEERNDIKSSIKKQNVSSYIEHFSGEKIPRYTNEKIVITDSSYESLYEKHQSIIDNRIGAEGSNNAFVRDVLFVEIKQMREKTDLSRLIQFLYRVTDEYPKARRSLLSPESSTRQTLVRDIVRAIKKGAPEWAEKLPSNFTETLESMKADAEMRANPNNKLGWDFPEKTTGNQEVTRGIEYVDPLKTDINYSYSALRQRFNKQFSQFAKNQIGFTQAGVEIFTNEFEKNGDKTRFNLVSQFIVDTLIRYHNHYSKGQDISSIINREINDLEIAINQEPSASKFGNQNVKFIETGLKISKLAAFGQMSWSFEKEEAKSLQNN